MNLSPATERKIKKKNCIPRINNQPNSNSREGQKVHPINLNSVDIRGKIPSVNI
jgi:hypothetical protein